MRISLPHTMFHNKLNLFGLDFPEKLFERQLSNLEHLIVTRQKQLKSKADKTATLSNRPVGDGLHDSFLSWQYKPGNCIDSEEYLLGFRGTWYEFKSNRSIRLISTDIAQKNVNRLYIKDLMSLKYFLKHRHLTSSFNRLLKVPDTKWQ